MKYFVIFIIIVYFFISCAVTPTITKKFVPIKDEQKDFVSVISNDSCIIKEINNLRIKVKFLTKAKLLEIARSHKNPYIGTEGVPQLTTFMVTVENNYTNRIFFDVAKSILLDNLGNQLYVLNYENFKELYPATYDERYEYSFMFNRYIREKRYSDDYYKRRIAEKTLFRGGDIYPKVIMEGIFPFPKVSEKSQIITLVIPDIGFYKNNEIKEKVTFKFQFKPIVFRDE